MRSAARSTRTGSRPASAAAALICSRERPDDDVRVPAGESADCAASRRIIATSSSVYNLASSLIVGLQSWRRLLPVSFTGLQANTASATAGTKRGKMLGKRQRVSEQHGKRHGFDVRLEHSGPEEFMWRYCHAAIAEKIRLSASHARYAAAIPRECRLLHVAKFCVTRGGACRAPPGVTLQSVAQAQKRTDEIIQVG